MHPDSKPITVNPVARPSRPKDQGNPRAYGDAVDRWREDEAAWKSTARPVVVVDVNVPWDAIWRLVFQVTVVSLTMGTILGLMAVLLLRYFRVI